MKAKSTILLAEDEDALATIIAESLEASGFTVTVVADGRRALALLSEGGFDLALLDVMMPGMDGFSVAKQLRLADQRLPILFLTSKTMPHDVVEGFESGGNDYLKKPFSMMELVVRIKALLGNNRLVQDNNAMGQVAIGSYLFDHTRQQLSFHTEVRQLTARETEILWLLYRQKQHLLTKQELLTTIWGDDSYFNARTLDVFVTRLRKLLKQDPRVQILNVRGSGYKLVW